MKADEATAQLHALIDSQPTAFTKADVARLSPQRRVQLLDTLNHVSGLSQADARCWCDDAMVTMTDPRTSAEDRAILSAASVTARGVAVDDSLHTDTHFYSTPAMDQTGPETTLQHAPPDPNHHGPIGREFGSATIVDAELQTAQRLAEADADMTRAHRERSVRKLRGLLNSGRLGWSEHAAAKDAELESAYTALGGNLDAGVAPAKEQKR